MRKLDYLRKVFNKAFKEMKKGLGESGFYPNLPDEFRKSGDCYQITTCPLAKLEDNKLNIIGFSILHPPYYYECEEGCYMTSYNEDYIFIN